MAKKNVEVGKATTSNVASAKDKKVTEPVKKESKMTRPEAVGLALKEKPTTMADWAKQADALYAKHGGLSNVGKMKADIMYMTKTLDVFGIVYPAK